MSAAQCSTMMLEWNLVPSLASLQEMVAAGEPRLVRFVAVERVGSAPEMVRIVDGIVNKLMPLAEGWAENYEYCYGGSGKNHFALGSSSEEEAEDNAGAEFVIDPEVDADPDRTAWWVFEGATYLRRIAKLANIGIELTGDILPALGNTPGDLDILERLHGIGVELSKAARLRPGAAGAQAYLVAKKARKLVNRTTKNTRGRPRPADVRANYVAHRLPGLVAMVNALMDTPVTQVEFEDD